MKRVAYLAMALIVAMLILVPTAMAQATKMEEKEKMEKTEEKLPPSGGPAVSSVLLPAAALLLGSGVLGYAILKRRQ